MRHSTGFERSSRETPGQTPYTKNLYTRMPLSHFTVTAFGVRHESSSGSNGSVAASASPIDCRDERDNNDDD